jgi:hypothetical protein
LAHVNTLRQPDRFAASATHHRDAFGTNWRAHAFTYRFDRPLAGRAEREEKYMVRKIIAIVALSGSLPLQRATQSAARAKMCSPLRTQSTRRPDPFAQDDSGRHRKVAPFFVSDQIVGDERVAPREAPRSPSW